MRLFPTNVHPILLCIESLCWFFLRKLLPLPLRLCVRGWLSFSFSRWTLLTFFLSSHFLLVALLQTLLLLSYLPLFLHLLPLLLCFFFILYSFLLLYLRSQLIIISFILLFTFVLLSLDVGNQTETFVGRARILPTFLS